MFQVSCRLSRGHPRGLSEPFLRSVALTSHLPMFAASPDSSQPLRSPRQQLRPGRSFQRLCIFQLFHHLFIVSHSSVSTFLSPVNNAHFSCLKCSLHLGLFPQAPSQSWAKGLPVVLWLRCVFSRGSINGSCDTFQEGWEGQEGAALWAGPSLLGGHRVSPVGSGVKSRGSRPSQASCLLLILPTEVGGGYSKGEKQRSNSPSMLVPWGCELCAGDRVSRGNTGASTHSLDRRLLVLDLHD